MTLLLSNSAIIFVDLEPVSGEKSTRAAEDLWYRTFGGRYEDTGEAVLQTDDGGFLIGGDTNSFGGMDNDIWLIKLDENGKEEWDKLIGSSGDEYLRDLIPLPDGNFYLVAYKREYIDDRSDTDIWIMKIDPSGSIIWDHTFGNGTYEEYCTYSVLTDDNGLLVSFFNIPADLDETAYYVDVGLMKISQNGTEEWMRLYDKGGEEYIHSILEVQDNNFLLSGTIYSKNYSSSQSWIFKIDGIGNILWNMTFMKNCTVDSQTLLPTDDDGFYICGRIRYPGYNYHTIIMRFNSSGFEQWNKTLFHDETGWVQSVRATPDGGYALLGTIHDQIKDEDDIIFLKTDSNFTIQWSKTYNYRTEDSGEDFISISGGGYAIIGGTDWGRYIYDDKDMILIKISFNGYTDQRTHGNSKPYTKILSPASFSTVSGLIEIKGESKDDDGKVESVEVRIDSGDWEAVDGTGTWTYTWNTTKLEDGEHTIYIRTYDGIDRVISHIDVLVDNIEDEDSGSNLKVDLVDLTKATRASTNYISVTSDGGYIITGSADHPEDRYNDVLLIKIDRNGKEEWKQIIGDDDDEYGEMVIETFDGYAILGGYFPVPVPDECKGPSDVCGSILLLKTDKEGKEIREVVLDAGVPTRAEHFQQTKDGGVIVIGSSEPEAGDTDIFLAKVDADGRVEWKRTYDGSHNDYGGSVMQTSDGGYIIGGSYNGTCLIKTDPDGNIQWNRTFYNGHASRAIQSSDGGYIIVYSEHNRYNGYKIIMVRTDPNGNEQWRKEFGGEYRDWISDVEQTSDGGYILAGSYDQFSDLSYGAVPWFIKTNELGEVEWDHYIKGPLQGSPRHIMEVSNGSYVAYGQLSDLSDDHRNKHIVFGINQALPALYEPDDEPVVEDDEDDDEEKSYPFRWAALLIGLIALVIFILILYAIIRNRTPPK